MAFGLYGGARFDEDSWCVLVDLREKKKSRTCKWVRLVDLREKKKRR